ncbi:hypothetical protein F5880DRAFT_267012 [Lentinula raphanica]|nr:hypothetical protein F5880DRAFT_267012 [Lentinula raphanica]
MNHTPQSAGWYLPPFELQSWSLPIVNSSNRHLYYSPETMLSSFHLLMFAAVLIVGLSHLPLITAAPVASVTTSVHHAQAATSYGFLGFHYVPQEVAEEYIRVRALTTAAVSEQHPYAALSDKSRPPGTSTTYWEFNTQMKVLVCLLLIKLLNSMFPAVPFSHGLTKISSRTSLNGNHVVLQILCYSIPKRLRCIIRGTHRALRNC